jgi:hypothetical protein
MSGSAVTRKVSNYTSVWGAKLGAPPGQFWAFDQELGEVSDKNCGIYSVKWLRKRRGGRFLNMASLDLDQEPGPDTEPSAMTLGPSVGFREKASQYKSQWLGGRVGGAMGYLLIPAAEKAVEFGFKEPGVRKFQRDASLDRPWDPTENRFEAVGNLIQHMIDKGKHQPAYFLVGLNGHFCAALANVLGLEWFDPSVGWARVSPGSEIAWKMGAFPYFLAQIVGKQPQLKGFREA